MDKEQQRVFYTQLCRSGIRDWWATSCKLAHYWYPENNGKYKYIYGCTPLMAVTSAFPFDKCEYPIDILKEFNDKWVNLCFEFGWVNPELKNVKPSVYKAAVDILFGIGNIQPDYNPKYALSDLIIVSNLLTAAIEQGKWNCVLNEDNYEELYNFAQEGIRRRISNKIDEHNREVDYPIAKFRYTSGIDAEKGEQYSVLAGQIYDCCMQILKRYKKGDYAGCVSSAIKVACIASNDCSQKSIENGIQKFTKSFGKKIETDDIVADIDGSGEYSECKTERVYLASNEILLSYNEKSSHYRLRFSASASDDIMRIGFFGYSLMLSPDRSKMYIKLSKEGIHGTIKPHSNSSIVINHKQMLYAIMKFLGIVDKQTVVSIGSPEVTNDYIKFELIKNN